MKRLEEALEKIQEGLDEMNELKDEICAWKEGMEGTNLECTAKYDELTECDDELSASISEIESGMENAEMSHSQACSERARNVDDD